MRRLAIVFYSDDNFDLQKWVDQRFAELQFEELEYVPVTATVMGITDEGKLV